MREGRDARGERRDSKTMIWNLGINIVYFIVGMFLASGRSVDPYSTSMFERGVAENKYSSCPRGYSTSRNNNVVTCQYYYMYMSHRQPIFQSQVQLF